MGFKRKNENERKLAALKLRLTDVQAEFDLFLENSSEAENPNHKLMLRRFVYEINQLKASIKELSK